MTATTRRRLPLKVMLVERLSRHLKMLVVFSGLLLVGLLTSLGNAEIKADLSYALATTSGHLSPLLVAYDTAGEFTANEVLKLSEPEIESAVKSWPHFYAPIYLQVINTRERVLFDSRLGKSASYKGLADAISPTPRYGRWSKEGPFLYVDWVPSGEGRWILRAAITAPNYSLAYAWRLALLILGVAGFGALALSVVEVRRRRRFDLLVDLLPKLLRQARDENTLIRDVPEIIARLLSFDSIAIYLLEGDRIIPKAYFSVEGRDPEAFLQSTDQMQIKVQDNYPESRAIQENTEILVKGPKETANLHLAKYDAAGSRPYLVVPIRRVGGETPLGLLTAQRYDLLAGEHAAFLKSGAEIVALLIDNFRNRETLRKMIRNTRAETVGTVVSSITHNMKNQLVVIDGLSVSLCKDLARLSQPELARRAEEIKGQTDLCFHLIHSISQYNKLGNTPNPVVALRQGLDVVFSLYSEYLLIKNIELAKQCQEDFEPSIRMEELDFVQVIENLLINAHDAFLEMRKNRDLCMARKHMKIEIILEKKSDKARISIADNGPGIPEKDLPRVFEEHFTTKDFGTGVGLPFCRRVVMEAGGNMEIISDYGIGTTVSIFLPLLNNGEV